MSLFKTLTISSIFFSTTLVAESHFSMNLNDTDVEIQSTIDLNNFMNYSSITNYFMHIDYLYSDGDNMTSVGLSAKNLFPSVEGLSMSFGIKSVFASDFIALPFTTKAEYILPLIEEIPITTLNLSFAYAPEIITFRDAKHYAESRVELDMEVISDIHLFAGYRHITTEYQSYEKTFNDHTYAGMKISF